MLLARYEEKREEIRRLGKIAAEIGQRIGAEPIYVSKEEERRRGKAASERIAGDPEQKHPTKIAKTGS